MSDGVASLRITLDVNGVSRSMEVMADETLADVLRGKLNLASCRETCGIGLCGSCTVVVNGRAVSACILPAFQADDAVVRTAEGLRHGAEPSPLQRAFIDEQAFQCSFCTPGFLMSLTAMLEQGESGDVRDALSGHICRCGSYEQIICAAECTVKGH